MEKTALQAQEKGLNAAAIEEYRGAITASRFGGPQEEFSALRESCGVYDLGFRARISIKGSDRVRWMNGMVTNNIRDLAVGHGLYAFLLNPQGHILGDLYAYNRGESIFVDTDRSQTEKILATFDHYIIMDDVNVTSLSDQWTTLGVAGPKAPEVMARAGLEFPQLQPLEIHTLECVCDCGCLQCTIIRSDDPAVESYEIWLAPEHVAALWDALLKAGASPIGSEALELQRIVSGIPRYGVDIRERDLPQETEQSRALNFNKGCYIGQEIVERIRSRGAVHRKFSGFLFNGEALLTAGTKIVVGDKEVGEVTSAASLRLPRGSKTVALGYIRREAGVPGNSVSAGNAQATVVELPMSDRALGEEESSLAQRPA